MMHSPYRISAKEPESTVDVELNDVTIHIYYLDSKNQEQNIDFVFTGYASAKYYDKENEPYTYPKCGSIQFNNWLKESHSKGMYSVNNFHIPARRLINIVSETKTYIKAIEIEPRK